MWAPNPSISRLRADSIPALTARRANSVPTPIATPATVMIARARLLRAWARIIHNIGEVPPRVQRGPSSSLLCFLGVGRVTGARTAAYPPHLGRV